MKISRVKGDVFAPRGRLNTHSRCHCGSVPMARSVLNPRAADSLTYLGGLAAGFQKYVN